MPTTASPWRRVSRRERCPICERPDWCLVAGPEGEPTAVICPRTAEGADRFLGEAGYLHRLRDDGWRPESQRRRVRRASVSTRRRRRKDAESWARRWFAAATDHDRARLGAELGVSIESLRRLRVGWASRDELERAGTRCAGAGAWTWPMRDAEARVVGVRLRAPDGAKFSVRGGSQGLFLSPDLDATERLLLPEGPTDTAALLDCGFSAVGRPSCMGGRDLLVALVRRLRPREAVVISDNDTAKPDGRRPGQEGAEALARALAPYVPTVRVVAPPEGAKDAREWVARGASVSEIEQCIEAVPARRVGLAVRRYSKDASNG